MNIIETLMPMYIEAHQLSAKATEEFENARYLISKYIKANSTKEIIFTRNATEAINLVLDHGANIH